MVKKLLLWAGIITWNAIAHANPHFDIVADKLHRPFGDNTWSQIRHADYYGNGIVWQANDNTTHSIYYTQGNEITLLDQATSTTIDVVVDEVYYAKRINGIDSLHSRKEGQSPQTIIPNVTSLFNPAPMGPTSLSGILAGAGKVFINVNQLVTKTHSYFALEPNGEAIRIAQTGDPIPGSNGLLLEELTDEAWDTNANGSHFAFRYEVGFYPFPDYQSGILFWDGNTLSSIANHQTLFPGTNSPINRIEADIAVLGDTVYFFARASEGGHRGILKYEYGNLTLVADQTSPDFGEGIDSLTFIRNGNTLLLLQKYFNLITQQDTHTVWQYWPNENRFTLVVDSQFKWGEYAIDQMQIFGNNGGDGEILLFAESFSNHAGLLSSRNINDTQSLITLPISFWSDVEINPRSLVKETGLGKINDSLWPYLYLYDSQTWLWIDTSSSTTKNGFYAYHLNNTQWIHTADSLNGWYFSFIHNNWLSF